jgi:hypothetical protein
MLLRRHVAAVDAVLALALALLLVFIVIFRFVLSVVGQDSTALVARAS